jgi:hypothetical protein
VTDTGFTKLYKNIFPDVGLGYINISETKNLSSGTWVVSEIS